MYLSVQQKMEEAQREKDELVKNMALLQQEKEQLEAEKESLQKECEQEKETCAQLRRENQVSCTLLKANRSASSKGGDKNVCCSCKKKKKSVSEAKGLVPFLLCSIVVLGCLLNRAYC